MATRGKHRPVLALKVLALATVLLHVGGSSAQSYPTKPIRIVTSSPGGGNDFLARLLAPMLTANLGRQVIVENRPSGVMPGSIVARALPDGYTLLLAGNDFWIGSLVQKTPYNPVQDFVPVALVASTPNIMVVHPSVPANTVKEFIALAKTRPGALNYASSARGGVSHLAAELFKNMAGVALLHVPYKGTGPALTAVIGNESHLMFPNVAAAVPHINAGRLKALALTSSNRSELMPELPTIAASGLPGYQCITTYGVFFPRGVPSSLVSRLSDEIAQVLAQPELKKRFLGGGVEPGGGGPERLAVAIDSDMVVLGRVIKENRITAD